MSTASHYPHIVIDGAGDAHVDQTGYKVLHLATEHFHHGWTAEELMRQHPDLRPEQVYAALAYFYDHHDQLVSAMESSAAAAETARKKQSLSRAELMRRRPNGAG